jgi:hypothetical protein
MIGLTLTMIILGYFLHKFRMQTEAAVTDKRR